MRSTTAAKLRGLAAAAALAVLVYGCSSSKGSSGTASTTTRPPNPTATTQPKATPTTVAGPDLAKLIPSSVPSGFTHVPDDVADTGPTNITKAAQDDLDRNGAAILRQAGFLQGYQRTWTKPGGGGDDNILLLYQFATPEGAMQYANHWHDLVRTPAAGQTVTSFPLLIPPPTFGERSQDKTASSAVVVFAHGPYAVQAIVHGGPNLDLSSAAADLAAAQSDRLP